MIRNSNETFIHLHRPPPGFYSWPENYFVFAMPQMWDETYLSESYKQQIHITISNQFRIRKHFFFSPHVEATISHLSFRPKGELNISSSTGGGSLTWVFLMHNEAIFKLDLYNWLKIAFKLCIWMQIQLFISVHNITACGQLTQINLMNREQNAIKLFITQILLSGKGEKYSSFKSWRLTTFTKHKHTHSLSLSWIIHFSFFHFASKILHQNLWEAPKENGALSLSSRSKQEAFTKRKQIYQS